MSKYYYVCILCLFTFFTSPLLAQNSLTGKVVDQQRTPVAYANVILLNSQDSTSVVKGAVTSEDGSFTIDALEAQEYVLRVSFVGFVDYLEKLRVSGDTVLQEIVLEESFSDLEEVSIRVKKPSIIKQVDRLVFNVENTSLSSGSSWDVLSKTPMVVISNDQLQVRNQSVQVYINDKKVHLSAYELKTLLENYSAENIKSVEVITTPPARYDAEGGTILNIVTSTNISPGYKGGVNGTYTQAVFPKYSLGTSHYFKSDKLNLFANYSFSPRKEFKEDDSYINFKENDQVTERWETDFDRTTRSNAHSANVILDYQLDDRNTLSLSSNAVLSPGKTFDNTVLTEVMTNQGTPLSSFATGSGLEEDQSNIGVTVDYVRQLRKEGAQFSAKAHYTRYDQDRIQSMYTEFFDDSGNRLDNSLFIADAEQGIDIVTGQLDYSLPIGNASFEAGVKASSISSESGIDYAEIVGETTPGPSDNFLYDENIFAGYASIAKDWDRWSLKAGLRGEYTDREGDSRSMNQMDSKQHFDLFPTFYAMHSLNANHSFSFDYSRRIQRPRYANLNPFRYYLNDFNFNEGNPNLRAAVSNNFNLNYTLQGQYFFDLYYRDNGPSSEILSFQDKVNRTLRNVSMNMLESQSYGLDITHGRSLASFWYAYTYMSFFHEEQTFLALESGNIPVTNEIDGFYGMLANSFTLSKDGTFSGSLNLIYISDWITGSYNLDPMTTLSLGLRKTFWNNRAELSLNLEDVLDKANARLTSKYLNQDNSYFAHPETQYVRVGFKYNFGNFRLSDNQRTIEAEERERI